MSPQERRARQLHGSLELLILKALALQTLHGVGLFNRIRLITDDAVSVSYGSLFPALHRLEERGWLAADWRASEHKRRAKYYRLTRRGRAQLDREQRAWQRIVDAVSAALRST